MQSQTWLDGSYENNKGLRLRDVYTYYTFTKAGTFEFHQGGHFGNESYATGTYQIQDSLLFLEYNTEPVLATKLEVREWKTFTDSITIRFKAINISDVCVKKDGFENPCFILFHKNKVYYQNRNFGIELRFKKQDEPFAFTQHNLFFHSNYFLVSINYDSEVSFSLLPKEEAYPLSGFTRKTKILSTKDGLLLQ